MQGRMRDEDEADEQRFDSEAVEGLVRQRTKAVMMVAMKMTTILEAVMEIVMRMRVSEVVMKVQVLYWRY
jgi:uncharacterized membrane-anchored protein